MPLSNKDRVAAYRARQKAAGKPDATRAYAKEHRKAWREKQPPGGSAPAGECKIYSPGELTGEVTEGYK